MTTTVTLRPSGTVSSSGLTAVGGGSLSDNSTGTGYTQTASGTAATLRLAWGTTALPSWVVLKSLTPRLSSAAATYSGGTGASASQVLTCQLLNSAYIGNASTSSTTSSKSAWTNTTAPNFGAFSGQLPYSTKGKFYMPPGLGFDPTVEPDYIVNPAYGLQAALDNIETLFTIGSVTGAGGGTPTSGITLYEAYLDVVYAYLPVAAAPSVIGTTVTNRPTITSVFNSSEASAKGKYAAVKIFTSAQKNAAFFNPRSSAYTWGKSFSLGGIAPGTGFSVTVDTDLPSGTYTVYIWVMDDISEGTWGDWSTPVGFTMNVPQLEACSVSVTAEPNDAYGPRQKIVITQTGNLVPQYPSGFEDMLFSPGAANNLSGNLQGVDTDTSGFSARAGCTIARTTTAGQTHVGNTALAVTTTSAGPNLTTVAIGSTPNSPVSPAGLYTFSTWVKLISGFTVANFRLDLEWYDSSGALISTSSSGTYNLNSTTTGWKQLTISAFAPSALIEGSDAAFVIPIVNVTTGTWTSGAIFALDSNTLYANEGLGFTPATTTILPTNLSVQSTTGFSDSVGSNGLRVTAPTTAGTHEVFIGGANAPDPQSSALQLPGSATAINPLIPAVAGATYTGGARIGHSSVSRTARFGLRWYNNVGALISTTWSTATATSTTLYASYTATGAAPANTAYVVPVVEIQASGTSETHWVDSVFVRAGSSTTWSVGGWAPSQGSGFLRNRVWFQIQRTDNGNDAVPIWKTIGYLQAAPAIAGGQPTSYHYGIDAVAGTIGSYSASAGALTVNAWDYSAPVNQAANAVKYRARSVLGAFPDLAALNESAVAASAWTAEVAAPQLAGSKFYLTDVVTPANSISLSIDSELSSVNEEFQAAFKPLGRNRHVVLTDGFAGEQFDSIELHFKTEAEWNKFETLRKAGRTILLQSDMFTQWWVRLGAVRQVTLPYKANRVSAPYRHVSIPAIEVDPVNEV